MRHLFKLHHPKTRYFVKFPMEETPDSICTDYYLTDEDAYDRVKSSHTPLSQLAWFVKREFNDEEEAELYQSMSDEDYFLNQVRHKVSYFMQELVSKWFAVLQSGAKPVEVHLFARSPLQHGMEYEFGKSYEGSIQVFFPSELIAKLLDTFQYRTYISPEWSAEPESDLLFNLDFSMIPWREGLNQEPAWQCTDQWMYWLWTLRNQGLARFASLQSGAGLEMNRDKIRQLLERFMNRLVWAIENGHLSSSGLPKLISTHQKLVRQIAPQLVLHALSVYSEQDRPKHLKEPIRSLRSSFSFYDDKVITKAYVYARKIDFERFLEYLTLPVGDTPPMIPEELLRKLTGMMRKLDGISTGLNDMLLGEGPLDQFDFLSKRKKGKGIVLEGVRLRGNYSVLDRFRLLAEKWS
jgi:hypothetical protein